MKRLRPSALQALLLDDWRIPFFVVSLMASLALASAVYFYVTLANTTDGLCELNANRIHDKERQIKASKEYLHTREGMKRTGLNDFIRKNSLPRLRRELKFERRQFPKGCRDRLTD